MTQTKSMSLVESITNVSIGFVVALATQLIVFPIFGLEVSMIDNLGIAVIFTVVSIVRSYLIRRLFNKQLVNNYNVKRETITGNDEFIYSEPPDKQAKVILLTKGKVAIVGPWLSGYGILAWRPLPKRNKDVEDRKDNIERHNDAS